MADFSEAQIQAIWEIAKLIPGLEDKKDEYRTDYAGAIIQRNMYGKGQNELDFGWTIDHIKPLAKGGSNDINNLVPLQWANNNSKSDDYPQFKTVVSSEKGDDQKWRNVEKIQTWKY
ncbi:MAG: HNH endonuclease [Salinivirgaceae bacterium]|nr:HNH endonuclease [Salinivirgaceae bacterium]